MLTLNLLPPEQKGNLNYEIDRRMVQFFGFWFFVIIIIFGALVLPAFFFISLQQPEVERAARIEEEARASVRTTETEGKILGINNLLDIIVTREEKKQNVPIGNVSFNPSRQKSENSMSVAKPARRKEINLSELKRALDESLAAQQGEPRPDSGREKKAKEEQKRDDLEDKNKGIIQPGQKIEF